MARHKTKKQKKLASTRVLELKLNLEPTISNQKELSPEFKTTFFSQSAVKLLYKDLLKTLIITIVVFVVLLSILVYMR